MYEHENCFWTSILVAILVSMILATSVSAQAAAAPIDLSKANFVWTWTQGTMGAAFIFRVRCGPTSGNYILVKDTADAVVRQMPMNQVITAEGTYFCAVYAINDIGASASSAEVSFRALKLPGPATSFEVRIQ